MPSRDRRKVDESHGKGVAELRSSVIRINSKNASPARRREKKGEKENPSCRIGRGKQGSIYNHARARTATDDAKPKGSRINLRG